MDESLSYKTKSNKMELPNDLRNKAMPYVVLTGLDITYNAIHKSIWDAFSNNRRADRLPINFAFLPGDHQYPQSKPKRTSYDWYIPKGILKQGWLNKHIRGIPGVVVVFFELDWDDLTWRERHLECASRVQVVRSSLQGRSSKVAVVLIQKSSPLPPGEDMMAAERAAALCAACDLSAKSLFVLPHTDHMLGYIIRLENAFYELAQSYYRAEARKVKSHKEFLNKTTHQLLFPRHQFKIAFFYEIMQEPDVSIKHYKQAYTHVHELRLYETNNLEVKAVGGYINYKICQLCFLKLNTPIDAITQFQRHVEEFKPQCGSKELLFEHSAWLSQQFLVFADLFNEAIVQGLSAIQTQNPGFYYQQAAHYAQLRRSLAKSTYLQVSNQPYPSDDPLNEEKMEFYGQRPWRPGHQRIDPPDMNREKEGILALQLINGSMNHSWEIIELFSSAIMQFKKFGCDRLKVCLRVQMAEEYYQISDFEKAIALFEQAIKGYRENKWCLVFTNILSRLTECALQTSDVKLYITFCVELLSKYSCVSLDKKKQHQDRFVRIFTSKRNAEEESAKMNDAESFASLEDFSIDIHSLLSFVDFKVVFRHPKVAVDSSVCMDVYSRVTCPSAIQFSQLAIKFNHSVYDEICVIEQKSQLCYEPYEVKHHSFEFPIDVLDANKTLSVDCLILKLGGENDGPVLTLKWPMSDKNEPSLYFPLKRPVQWNDISTISSTQIVERESRVAVSTKHESPALVDEIYPIEIIVESTEAEISAEHVVVMVSLKPKEGESDLCQGTRIAVDAANIGDSAPKVVELDFGDLKVGERKARRLYVQSLQAGSVSFSFRVSYDGDDVPVRSSGDDADVTLKTISCESHADSELNYDVVSPFSFNSHVTTQNLESTPSIYANQPFVAMATVAVNDHWAIEIEEGVLHLSEGVGFSFVGEPQCTIKDVVLFKRETAFSCFLILFRESPDAEKSSNNSGNAGLGLYKLKWRRYCDNDEASPFVTTSMKMPIVSKVESPLGITASAPAYGILRRNFQIQYNVTNTGKVSQMLEVGFGVVDTFMFSGTKVAKAFLPPGGVHTFTYNLIPLSIGFQVLPKIQISSLGEGVNLNSVRLDNNLLQSALPSHIFIKPTHVN